MSTMILNQQFYPSLCRAKRRLPNLGWGKLLLVERICQGRYRDPRGLMSFLDFRVTQTGVGGLVHQLTNHFYGGFVTRQARLAEDFQRVLCFCKIRVVTHDFLTLSPDKTLGTAKGFEAGDPFTPLSATRSGRPAATAHTLTHDRVSVRT
jgi:hypothetical protein